MALASAAEVRAFVPALASADDTRLDTLIARADTAFARYCHHPRNDAGTYTMEVATYTLYPGPEAIGWGSERYALTLPLPDLATVTSVHVDPEQDYGADTLVDSAYYAIRGRAIEMLIDTDTVWSESPRANKVVVTAGYDPDDDDDIKQACIIQVTHWVKNLPGAGSRNSSTQQSSRTVDRLGLLDEVKDLLDPYRIPVP